MKPMMMASHFRASSVSCVFLLALLRDLLSVQAGSAGLVPRTTAKLEFTERSFPETAARRLPGCSAHAPSDGDFDRLLKAQLFVSL